MTTIDAAPASASPTAQDIGRGVLALIRDARGIADLAPDNIERHTGLRMQAEAGQDNGYGSSGKLTDVWYYALRTLSAAAGSAPNRLLFQLNDQSNAGADMTPVCVEFAAYQQALTDAGYAATRLRNRVNTQDYWEFARGDIGVTVYLRGRRTPDDAEHCIAMLIINAYD